MPELKIISRDAVPTSLDKADRYRLLNEPELAESICLDVLEVEPESQRALVTLLLALTEQFRDGPPDCYRQAEAVLPRLNGEYERLYYGGIICERRGYARALQGGPGSPAAAYHWVRQAMEHFERAEKLRPPGNDDSLLRYNSCVRLCERYHLQAEEESVFQPLLGDD